MVTLTFYNIFFIDFNPTFPNIETTRVSTSTHFKLIASSSTNRDCSNSNNLCPENWVLGENGYCFRYFHEKQSYEKATETCQSYDAFLPHVRSKLDDNYLILLQCYTEKAKLFQKPETIRSRTSQWIGLDKIDSEVLAWQDSRMSIDFEE